MLTLFTAPGSCSRASHIALEESGLAFDVRLVNFAEGQQQSTLFLQTNPKGRVPALVTDRGTLTESPAILSYIAQLAPAAELAPFADAFALAQLQSFNAYICSTVHVAHAHGPRAARWADDATAMQAMQRKVSSNMAACFALIEEGMLAGPWVMGAAYSIADPYLFVMSGWLAVDDVDVELFPKVSTHYRQMLERPAVIRTLTTEERLRSASVASA